MKRVMKIFDGDKSIAILMRIQTRGGNIPLFVANLKKSDEITPLWGVLVGRKKSELHTFTLPKRGENRRKKSV
ncbi:MAG: hypothetical protein IKU22_09970 [Alistipes sp.]|nr:hypothetical protein [Alistipes sp.]